MAIKWDSLIAAVVSIWGAIPTVTGQIQCRNVTLSATETANYLNSPNYPGLYLNNMDCQWHITTSSPSNVIVLTLMDFYLEAGTSCGRDFVDIRDGNSVNSTRMDILCGEITNTQTYTSSGNSMTVVFHTDDTVTYKGFRFQYISQKKLDQCSDVTLWANRSISFLTSPFYPNHYPGNLNCHWHITTSILSSVIVLKVLDFSLEDYMHFAHYVALYDGSSTDFPIIDILKGNVSSSTFTSSGSSMTVVFHSDSYSNHKGFRLEYFAQESTGECTDVRLSAVPNIQYFTSPGYPNNYPNNVNCQWLITTSLPSNVVVLRILEFYTEGSSSSCSDDHVTIYDGDSIQSPKMILLCDQVSNTTLTSTGPFMTVVFHSDSINSYKGFKFEYISQSKAVLCGNNNLWASDAAKYLTSPGYPNDYPSNFDCQWHITASLSSNVILLRVLDFYIEGTSPSCIYDYLAIYDGYSTHSPRIELLCGTVSYTQFISTGSSMTLVFHSDSVARVKGFKLEYTSHDKPAPCSGVTLLASDIANYITSPNYPFSYPSNAKCQWQITTSSDSLVVSLTFPLLSLEGSQPDCIADSVGIYNGPSTDSRQLALLCGQLHDVIIDGSNTDMTIVFHSDGINNFGGFNFTYHAKPKPRTNVSKLTY